MRILCDQHVPAKYLNALSDAEGIIVTTISVVLEPDASDERIAAFAAANDWVVFTNDDDFYVAGGDHGLLFYSQIEDPAPGVIVDAVQRIDEVYESTDEILESVPGGWA